MKTCTKCRQRLPLEEFYSRFLKSGNLHILAACKQCTINAVRIRDQKPENKARQKELHFERRYNVSMEEYRELLKLQGGVCAICKLPETYLAPSTYQPRLLAVDHDHVTGTVRGLLCSKCNRALGFFGDDISILKAALAYLENHAG